MTGRKPETELRVLSVAPHFGEYTFRLVSALSERVHVLAGFERRNYDVDVPAELRATAPNLETFFFETRNRPRRWLAYIAIIWRCLTFRPHIVHFQESANPVTIDLAPIVARVWPVVITAHDPVPHIGRDTVFAEDRWRRRLKARRRAALVLGHGPACTDQLRTERAGGLTNVGSTRHGAILVPIAGQTRAAEPGRILFFGRLEAYKGLDVLVGAGGLLQDRSVDFEMMIAGSGPELEKVNALAKISPNITVRHEWITTAEAVEEFQRASIVVLPYLEATQSGVLAAAFANGRPVVATRVGGLTDAIVDNVNGVLVEPGSEASLADALEALIKDPARLARLSAGAQVSGQTDLDWRPIADDLIADYKAVVPSWR